MKHLYNDLDELI